MTLLDRRLARWLVMFATLGCSPDVLIATRPDVGSAGGQDGAGGSLPTTAGVGAAGTSAGTSAGGTAGEAGEAGGSATEEPISSPRLLADSAADFSLVQGRHGWFYGYMDGAPDAPFLLMSEIAEIETYMPPSGDVWQCWAVQPGAYWTQLFRLGGHANGTITSAGREPVLQLAVRRWISTYEGEVTISGELAKIAIGATSNGIVGRVLVDGRSIWEKTVGGDDGGGVFFDVSASLAVGTPVDFVLDPNESDDRFDLSRFTAVIHLAEPGPRP